MMTPRTSGPIDLSGQVALVTGAARGIGRAIALALAREGAEVACADLLPAAETVAVVGALGRRAIAVGGDVSRLADARRMVGTTVRRLGRLDILVNNAGIAHRDSLDETSEHTWQRVVDVDQPEARRSAAADSPAVLPKTAPAMRPAPPG
jgi:2-deoxy-D-gluconate 3-dehydrogenase